MEVELTGTRVIIEAIGPWQTKEKDKVVLSGIATKDLEVGKVIAASQHCIYVKEGNYVVYEQTTGGGFTLDGKTYKMISKEDGIIGVVPPPKKLL